MAQVTYSKQYSDAIQAIKQAILQSRYTAARLINRGNARPILCRR